MSKNAIGEKQVHFATYFANHDSDAMVNDKLWLFSMQELYGYMGAYSSRRYTYPYESNQYRRLKNLGLEARVDSVLGTSKTVYNEYLVCFEYDSAWANRNHFGANIWTRSLAESLYKEPRVAMINYEGKPSYNSCDNYNSIAPGFVLARDKKPH